MIMNIKQAYAKWKSTPYRSKSKKTRKTAGKGAAKVISKGTGSKGDANNASRKAKENAEYWKRKAKRGLRSLSRKRRSSSRKKKK